MKTRTFGSKKKEVKVGLKKKKCIKVYDGGMKRKAGRQAQNIQDNGIKNSYSISPRLEK